MVLIFFGLERSLYHSYKNTLEVTLTVGTVVRVTVTEVTKVQQFSSSAAQQ